LRRRRTIIQPKGNACLGGAKLAVDQLLSEFVNITHGDRPRRDDRELLVVTVDLAYVAAMDQNLDRIRVVSGASVYPLVWNILLAARNDGYGGTITTMAIPEEEQLRDLLGIPAGHAVAALVPMGKPVKQLTKLRRRPVEEFTTRDRFDGEPFSVT
jgi:nitroreductase